MSIRESIAKYICVGIVLFFVYTACSSLVSLRADTLVVEPARAQSRKQARMAPFDSSFWKNANYREKEIPASVPEMASKLTVHEEIFNVKDSQLFSQSCLPPAGMPSSGQFVLLLHGAAFSSQTWRELGTIQLLAAMGHTVVAIDLPGYGRSKSSSLSPSSSFIPAVVEALQHLPIFRGQTLKRPVIVSPSMSGGFSMPLLRDQANVPADKTFMSGFVPVAPVNTRILSPEDAHNLQVPTVIVRGENDLNLGLSSEKDLREIPSSQIIVLPDAGHPAYLKQPDMFHQILYNFLILVNEYNPPSSF